MMSIKEFPPKELEDKTFDRQKYIDDFIITDEAFKIIDFLIKLMINGTPQTIIFGTQLNEQLNFGQIAYQLLDNIIANNEGRTENECWLLTCLLIDEIYHGANDFWKEQELDAQN